MTLFEYISMQVAGERAVQTVTDINELGRRAASGLFEENAGDARERERVVRHLAIDAVLAAALRVRAEVAA